MKKTRTILGFIALVLCVAAVCAACGTLPAAQTPDAQNAFVITTDLDRAPIANDVLVFAASATFRGAPCEVAVAHNGAPLPADGEGKYCVTLSVGENAFDIVAREGEDSHQRRFILPYAGIQPVTSLADGEVREGSYSFTAAATYAGQACEVDVSCNGAAVQPGDAGYRAELKKGENTLAFRAVYGRVSRDFVYTIRYRAQPPTITATLPDSVQIRSDVYHFAVTAHDGAGNNLSAQVAFAVDWEADDGEERFESVSGISLVWADSDQTSYRMDLQSEAFAAHAGQAFLLRITATDSEGETARVLARVLYLPAQQQEAIGSVVVAIEGFTIGMGYFLAPTRVPIYNGVNGAQMLTTLLREQGLDYDHSGRVESGFYLESIYGLDLTGNRIPDALWARVAPLGYERTYADADNQRWGLGEFCYGYGSGWMYSVNGVFYNYGFSDYVPQDGDVVRVVFTLLYGADVGGSSAMGGGGGENWLDEVVDYDPVMTLLADIAAQGGLDRTVWDAVIEQIGVWNLSQADMDEALAALRAAYGRYL